MAPFATLLSRLTALTFIVPVSESFHIVTTEAKTGKPQHLAIASAVQPLRTGDGNRRDSINVLSAASGRTCPLSLCARTESTSSVFGVRCSRLQRGSCSVSCHASQDSRGVDAMDADSQVRILIYVAVEQGHAQHGGMETFRLGGTWKVKGVGAGGGG